MRQFVGRYPIIRCLACTRSTVGTAGRRQGQTSRGGWECLLGGGVVGEKSYSFRRSHERKEYEYTSTEWSSHIVNAGRQE